MASRACLLLAVVAGAVARDCIELTLSDSNLDTIFNGTLHKVTAKNESEFAKFDVVQLWDRFPRVVVPRNGTSEQCRRESQLFLDSLERLELWALKSNFSFFFAC